MIPYGTDAPQRVARHRLQRADKGFETIERYTDLAHVDLQKSGVVLLECLGNLVANEMFEPGTSGSQTVQVVMDGINAIAEKAEHLIVVTNDVASDGAEYEKSVLDYVSVLGELNCRLAQDFDCVCELCCGIPIVLKGELP